jgi:hypothetical protein
MRQLQHPILQTLVGTEFEWIKDLIVAFNHGKIDVLDSLSGHFVNEVCSSCCKPKNQLTHYSRSCNPRLRSCDRRFA